MKFLNISLFSIILVLAFNASSLAQSSDTTSLNTILSKTQSFSSKYPQEKVHIHFDKPYYAVGDTIWFKAYVTSGLHIPSPLSKIIYVDVISDKDTVIQTLKLPVNNSSAWGNIALNPQAFKQGNYRIWAYTRWMINFDANYYFKKTISIGSGDKEAITHITFSNTDKSTNARIVYKDASGTPYANKKVSWEVVARNNTGLKGKGVTNPSGVLNVSIPLSSVAELKNQNLQTALEITNGKSVTSNFSLKSIGSKVDLQFFPEGGEIINGIPTKVAFKALGTDGKSVNVSGTVTDNDGKNVMNFSSQHLGMGSFILVPEGGKTYTATITSPANHAETYKLPEVKTAGITLMVNNVYKAENLNLRVICNDNFYAANQNRKFYIVAKVGEVICYAAQTVLQNQVFSASIPKDKFPTGIVQITLFSDRAEPISERLAFIERNDNLNLTLKTDKPVYGRRQKVRLGISAKSGNLPVEANLSVAVIDESKVPFDENAETSILSNLLLTSDLQGFVEKPNYYFNKSTEKTAADLDLLMLTQGYRRFLFSDILADKFPKIYFLPEQGIEITGVLRNSTGMPLNKANVRLRIPDKYYNAYAVTNGSGVFRFQNVVVLDSSEVIVTSSDYSIKNPMLTIDPIAIQPALPVINWPDEPVNIDSTMTLYMQNNKKILNRVNLLKEVVIKGTQKVNVPSHTDYPALTGLSAWPDHLISKDRLGNCATFLICVQSMAMGVTYENQNFYVTRDYNTGNRVPMSIFYNGMPVDANFLNSINSPDIESVEVFLKDDLGLVNRTYSTNGVLVINSKKVEKKAQMKLDDIRNLLPKAGEVKFTPQGYTITKEFYSPKYITPPGTINGTDLRSTIYWNPRVNTDKTTGNSLVEFYNADSKGTYKAIIEGIDAEGRIGRFVYKFKVE